jgi:hypothetical protein
MNKNPIILSFLIFFSIAISAQTTWKVEQSDFVNENLYFYTYKDYISKQIDTICQVKTNGLGGFEAQVDIPGVKYVFVDLGVYRASFYNDSKHEAYQFQFPEKRQKTTEEELDVFFKYIEIKLPIVDNLKKEINPLLSSFDDIYNDFISRNFDSIYYAPSSAIIDDFKRKMDAYYSSISNEYFETYRNYKIYELYFLGPNRGYNVISKKFYDNKPLQLQNESYMNLFNKMYQDFFVDFKYRKEGKDLMNQLQYSRSPQKLIKTIQKLEGVSDAYFAELVLVKGLRDGLLNPTRTGETPFPKPQLRIVLDSIAEFSDYPELRNIAKNVKKQDLYKDTKKLFNIDEFNFEDVSGNVFKLSEFAGKYIYLNFMRADVVDCMESMDRMINFYKQHSDDIEIVTVFTDKNKDNYLNIDFEKYNWKVLYIGEDRSVLEKFNLVTWPQFHLIDPYGKLIVSPAPNLQEKFEQRFYKILESRS